MSFNVLTIRTADASDSSMFPTVGTGDAPITFEPSDGEDIDRITASALRVSLGSPSGLQKIAAISDIKASVYVTDGRVAIACTKYEKGGGWIGTSLAVPVLNAASHARAALHRRGKCLVGHVRYPWLRCVGYSPKRGWSDFEQVRLGLSEKVNGADRNLYLDLTLPKQVDSGAVARSIAVRAARFRLNRDADLSDEERLRLTELLDPPALNLMPKQFSLWTFPTYFFANPTTAFPKETAR